MFSLEIVTLARLLIDEARERSLRIVTAESCVAMTDNPTAHHGRLRFARKYPSISFVPLDFLSPWITTYVSHPITITQFNQCMMGMGNGG